MIVKINDREVKLAQSWNELSTKQVLSAYQIIMTPFLQLLPSDQELAFKRLELSKLLLGIDQAFIERWQADCYKSYGVDGALIFGAELQELSLATTAMFFEQVDEQHYQIRLGLTKCPFPVLTQKKRGKKTYYYAPANELENITIYELGQTFMSFEAYINTGEDQHLNTLLAILYRPRKPVTKQNKASNYGGDRRLPLDGYEATLPDRATLMARLPKLVKQVIVLWFASCRQAIIDAFPNLFKASEDKEKRSGNDYAWGGVLLNLAGGIIHLDAVVKQPYATALIHLSMLEDERKESARKAKQRRQSQ